jgi:hypothetical protein
MLGVMLLEQEQTRSSIKLPETSSGTPDFTNEVLEAIACGVAKLSLASLFKERESCGGNATTKI